MFLIFCILSYFLILLIAIEQLHVFSRHTVILYTGHYMYTLYPSLGV